MNRDFVSNFFIEKVLISKAGCYAAKNIFYNKHKNPFLNLIFFTHIIGCKMCFSFYANTTFLFQFVSHKKNFALIKWGIIKQKPFNMFHLVTVYDWKQIQSEFNHAEQTQRMFKTLTKIHSFFYNWENILQWKLHFCPCSRFRKSW